ncbi:SctK family type III secretion system sorting platform protein [Piscinibacter terrae]|uniref:Uncharacterized protein n=1 Tax=Piscinibacter terrae TaxID=2496871 RepID=A0A3N7IR10_9BURK|nr:SctK family type III secretion system sorting platform protein [Albitalea terrae]RQP21322.1 hypothetical protein DZC73_27880 [Albitalea terrae]
MTDACATVGCDLTSSAWVRTLLRFNLSPASYADPSWLPRWAADAAPAVIEALSVDLLRDRGLDTAFDWHMPKGPGRFFMLAPRELAALSVAVGIAAHRDSLRQVVLKPRLGALRSSLGDALDTLWLPVAEAVPRSVRPLSISWEPLDAPRLRQTLRGEGMRQLLRFVDAGDPAQKAVASRAVLCAPREVAANLLPRLPADEAAHAFGAIVTHLIPRWAPSWTWLF